MSHYLNLARHPSPATGSLAPCGSANDIHAFCGGNGGASRALAYLVAFLDVRLSGEPSLPAVFT
jgi:hypothetical protein